MQRDVIRVFDANRRNCTTRHDPYEGQTTRSYDPTILTYDPTTQRNATQRVAPLARHVADGGHAYRRAVLAPGTPWKLRDGDAWRVSLAARRAARLARRSTGTTYTDSQTQARRPVAQTSVGGPLRHLVDHLGPAVAMRRCLDECRWRPRAYILGGVSVPTHMQKGRASHACAVQGGAL